MLRLAVFGLSLALVTMAGPVVAIDYCVDLRAGGGVYDCNDMPPGAIKKPIKANPEADRLRKSLSDKLKAAGNTGEAQRVGSLRAAVEAAYADCQKGDIAGFERHMSQANSLAADAADNNMLIQVRTVCTGVRTDPIARPPPPPQVAAAPAPPPAVAPTSDPNLFTICDTGDRQGVQTCYEVPPSGYSCRKVLKKGGDAIWADNQATCDSSVVLQQRNTHFNKMKAQTPPPLFGADETRKQSALDTLSPQCKAQLNNLLQGADTGDREKAYSAYGGLRAQCDAQMRALANAAEVGLPERLLSGRAQSLTDKAMGGDSGRLAQRAGQLAEGRTYDASYDMGEVIGFGLDLLNLLSGFAGVYVAIPNGAGAAYSGAGGGGRRTTTYGQGSPTHAAPRTPASTITGPVK